MPNVLLARGTTQAVLSTALNSMANNTNVLSSTITITDAQRLMAQLELVFTFLTAPTANTAFVLWILQALDDSTFEDGGASVTPTRTPDAFFPVRAVTTLQRVTRRIALPPGGAFQFLLRNDGTSQQLTSSGHSLNFKPYTESF